VFVKKILITGAAGFIGYNLLKSIERLGFSLTCIDNFFHNHDFEMKVKRVEDFGFNYGVLENKKNQTIKNVSFHNFDLNDRDKLDLLFKENKFDVVINLAAQTGVRYSVTHPHSYVENNITAFLNVLECCKKNNVKNLIFSSSSSVYGMNDTLPYKEGDNTDLPASFYAVTKKTNELMAYAYSMACDLSYVALRFFTVYGPWCRTDMASYIFIKSIIENKEISLYNEGDMLRDFTYVDDVTESIIRVIDKMLETDIPIKRIINVGNSHPYTLNDFLSTIEFALGKKVKILFKPIQEGDIRATYAEVTALYDFVKFKPSTLLEDGVKKMVMWYRQFYGV